MLVNKSLLIRIRKGEELKTPRYASAAASRDDRLPLSRQYLLLYKIGEEKYFRVNFVDNYLLLLPYYLIKAKGYTVKILKIR